MVERCKEKHRLDKNGFPMSHIVFLLYSTKRPSGTLKSASLKESGGRTPDTPLPFIYLYTIYIFIYNYDLYSKANLCPHNMYLLIRVKISEIIEQMVPLLPCSDRM